MKTSPWLDPESFLAWNILVSVSRSSSVQCGTQNCICSWIRNLLRLLCTPGWKDKVFPVLVYEDREVIAATQVCLDSSEFIGAPGFSETNWVRSHTLHISLKFSDASPFFPALSSLNSGIFLCFADFYIQWFNLVSKENVWFVSQSSVITSALASWF